MRWHDNSDPVPYRYSSSIHLEVRRDGFCEDKYSGNNEHVLTSCDDDGRYPSTPIIRWHDNYDECTPYRRDSSRPREMLGEGPCKDETHQGVTSETRKRLLKNCDVDDRALISRMEDQVDRLIKLLEKCELHSDGSSGANLQTGQTVAIHANQNLNLKKCDTFERLQKLVKDNRLIADRLNDELKSINVLSLNNTLSVLLPVQDYQPSHAADDCSGTLASVRSSSYAIANDIFLSEAERSQGEKNSSCFFSNNQKTRVTSVMHQQIYAQYDGSPLTFSSCKKPHIGLEPAAETDTSSGDRSKCNSVIQSEIDEYATLKKVTENKAFGLSDGALQPVLGVGDGLYHCQTARLHPPTGDVFKFGMSACEELNNGSGSHYGNDANSHQVSLEENIDNCHSLFSSSHSPLNNKLRLDKLESRLDALIEENRECKLQKVTIDESISVADRRVAWYVVFVSVKFFVSFNFRFAN